MDSNRAMRFSVRTPRRPRFLCGFVWKAGSEQFIVCANVADEDAKQDWTCWTVHRVECLQLEVPFGIVFLIEAFAAYPTRESQLSVSIEYRQPALKNSQVVVNDYE